MNALVAEMNGREWIVPPSLNEGMNVNLVEEVMAHETLMEQSCSKNYHCTKTIPDTPSWALVDT